MYNIKQENRYKKVSIYNNYSPNYKQKRQDLNSLLKKYSLIPLPKGDLIMVVGGDGTFLSAVREKWRDGVPFIPVNDGNLGFFSEYKLNEIETLVKELQKGNYIIEEFPLYDFEIHHTDGRITNDIFLNDLTIKQHGSKVLHLDLVLNKEHAFPYSCDGVVISSYVGSTAYNKSLNSSVLVDKIKSFQVTPIAPVTNKRYEGISQPIIINDSNYIEIFPSHKKKRQSLVVADNKEYFLKNGVKKIVIKNKNKHIKLLRTKAYDYRKNILDKVF